MKFSITLAIALNSLSAFSQQNSVVIELFTSQGCSSCPSADKNLAEIIESAEKNGQPVYGLSFHVDYWNYLGWRDPYGKPEYTARQKAYSQTTSSGSVYTPQMIVNGIAEFVGSDKKASADAVGKALAMKQEYYITLKSVNQTNDKLSIAYLLNNLPTNLIIHAAVVARNLENKVLHGENSGRRLAHRNVVRSFVSGNAMKEGVLEIDFTSDPSANSVVVFVQDQQGHILGAIGKRLQ
jgi:hypothetical protein